MNKKNLQNLHPIQLRVPENLLTKLEELKQHGFSPAEVLRQGVIEAVNAKLEKARKAGI